MAIASRFLELLRCPVSGERLRLQGNTMRSEDGKHSYPVSDDGIPLFAQQALSEDARRQQTHYDRVAKQYLENLAYPHTQEYMRYLDAAFLEVARDSDLGTFAELCCGGAEGVALLKGRIGTGIGVDISAAMLASARRAHPEERFLFVQGDATRLPLESSSFETVVILGGVHHVNDRRALFREVARVLRPGGRFLFREPVSDFLLWKWLRSLIYKLSPALDADTERPLLYSETVAPLAQAGLRLAGWKTYGFFGYCVLMNSDVLVFNRLFRFVPGIRALTRLACAIDDLTIRLPGMSRMGLIVIGVVEKPAN